MDPLPRLAVSKARLKGEDPDSEEGERFSCQLTRLPVLMALYHQKKKIKEKNIVWTEFPQSRRAAEKDVNKDSALGKILLLKKNQRKKQRLD